MTSQFWWEEEAPDVAAGIALECVNALSDLNKQHLEIAEHAYQLYDGRGQLVGGMLSPTPEPGAFGVENILKATSDTGLAMIARQIPRAVFLTDDADWDLQQQSELAEKFVEGSFEQGGFRRIAPLVVRDGIISPLGCCKIIGDRKRLRIRYERVLLDEIRVDEWASRSSTPREYWQTRPVDRYVLRSWIQRQEEDDLENRDEILAALRRAGKVSIPDRPGMPRDLVYLNEAWRLPSEPGMDDEECDGHYGMFLEGYRIQRKKWKRERPPFVFFRWCEATIGFFGTPLAAEVMPIQDQIHNLNRKLEMSIARNAMPFMEVPKGDLEEVMKVMRAGDSEVEGGIIVPVTPGTGGIQVKIPPAVSPDIAQRIDRLNTLGFQLPGLGMTAAFGKKPPDIRSALGQREHVENESARHVIPAQQLEWLVRDAAIVTLDEAREMHEEGFTPKARWNDRNVAKLIRWDDFQYDEDRFNITVDIASIASRTPSARMDFVKDMIDIDPKYRDRAMAVIGIPDIDKEQRVEAAPIRHIDKIIWRLIRGEAVVPEQFDDLEIGLDRVTRAYNDATDRGAPAKVLENFRNWLEAAKDMQLEQMQEAMKLAQAQAGAVPGGPAQPAAPMIPEGSSPEIEALMSELGVGAPAV